MCNYKGSVHTNYNQSVPAHHLPISLFVPASRFLLCVCKRFADLKSASVLPVSGSNCEPAVEGVAVD